MDRGGVALGVEYVILFHTRRSVLCDWRSVWRLCRGSVKEWGLCQLQCL